jgi:hypothetical protein
MKKRIRHPLFLAAHLLLPLAFPLMALYRYLIALLPPHLTGCPLHDYLFLYCPVCGGTRAAEAILRLDFLGALRANAFVALAVPTVLVLDIVAWVRYARGKTPLLRVPTWAWIAFAASLVGYGILRNYLMLAHGIDPTGDLGAFWRAVL